MKYALRIALALIAIMSLSSMARAETVSPSGLSADEKCIQGLKFIQAGEFTRGWTLLELARTQDSQSRCIVKSHPAMAFYILQNIIDNKQNYESITVQRLIEVLQPFTQQGTITDPMEHLYRQPPAAGNKMIVSPDIKTTIDTKDALAAARYPLKTEQQER